MKKQEYMKKVAIAPLLPILAAGGKWLLGALVTGAVANAVGQAGKEAVDAWNTDDKAVATSLFNGNFDTLSESQKKLLQKYKTKYNIDLNDANSRNSAASKIQDSIESTKKWVGTGAQLVTYATPAGLLKAPVKAAGSAIFKRIFPKAVKGVSGKLLRAPVAKHLLTGPQPQKLFSKATGKKMLKDMAITYSLFHGIPMLLGIPEQKVQSAQRASADLPNDLSQYQPANNIEVIDKPREGGWARAGRIGDALLLGIPSFVSGLVKDKAVGEPREVTRDDLAIAKSQLQAQGLQQIPVSAIVARARENAFNQKVQQRLAQVPTEDTTAAKQKLSEYASDFQQLQNMTPQQRRQKLKSTLSGSKDMSPRHFAATLSALQDPKFRGHLFSGLYSSPKDLVRLAKDLKALDSNTIATPAGKLLKEVLQGAITQDAAFRYISGLQTAEDKFGFVKQWLDASKQISKQTGISISNPEIKQITNKVLWQQVRKNPLSINKVLALKAYESDLSGIGDFLNSPGSFYGTLAVALPLTTAFASSLFNRNNQDQQQMAYINQAAPVQRSIADRGLV